MDSSTQLRKLARTSMPMFRAKQLKEQGGLCLLCGQPIDLRIKGEGAIDHDHQSGRIRGILHRSCNAAEGKVANAAGRWGAKSMDYAAILPWLESLVDYLRRPALPLIYHDHKTDDEKRELRNAKERKRRAATRATRVVKSRKSAE